MEFKNKNKQSLKIPFMLLIGVILFSLGVNAANAASITTNNSTIYVNNQGNDTWDGQSAMYNGTSGPKQTITNAIGTVADNGTIYIASGTYNGSDIQISTNMTIIGENQQNTIIDARGHGNIFVITPGEGISLTLVNLTLQNGDSTIGGAIENEGSDGVLNFTNVTFNNNTATNIGGAIYSIGTLSETNDTFTNNTSINGGGAIYNYGSLNETNDTFNNNKITYYGGAVYNGGSFTESNDTFNNNKATYYGGAIYNCGAVNETNDIFNNNTASDGGVIVNYGAVTETYDTLNNNGATNGDGGAIFNYGTVTETNDTFTNNTATNGPGGAIVNWNVVNDTNCTFTSNTAIDGAGGAIINCNAETDTNCTFTNNTAIDGGAIDNDDGTVIETNDIFTYNTAAVGGAIYNSENCALNFSGCKFVNNAAIVGDGSIYNIDGILALTNTAFSNNTSDQYNIHPIVDITNPLNSTFVHGVVPINVNSTGTVSVTKIVFSINGISYTDNNGAGGCSYNWNTSGLTDGIYNITVTAYDAANNCQIQTISVNVDNTIPTVSANPTSGLYKTPKTVTLTMSKPGTIYYYITNGTTPINTCSVYSAPISISANTTLNYFAIDLAGNTSPIYTQTYTIDTISPTSSATPTGGLYNTNKIITIKMSEPGTIYYTLNGSTPTTYSTKYDGSITITKTTTLNYIAIDLAGNESPIYTQNYTIDTIPPKVSANVKGGLYNTNKVITLTMSKPGTIYYTLNGTTPTTKSTLYTKPITISSTTILKYLAIDLANNKSSICVQNYIIDKTAPKVVKTNPSNGTIKASLTTPMTITFSENIIKGSNYNNIYVKNLNTGNIVAISKTLSKNTLTIQMTKSRLHNDTYIVFIPKDSFKDQAGNLTAGYSFRFKTG